MKYRVLFSVSEKSPGSIRTAFLHQLKIGGVTLTILIIYLTLTLLALLFLLGAIRASSNSDWLVGTSVPDIENSGVVSSSSGKVTERKDTAYAADGINRE
ncbi:hypothetical protein [Kushneria phosphatilytica]|uniref:Uncharacterized protein n=1 Tax=Kushneria phosphatilytica TaxID=657387 RepID=A0A5C0ZV55_9GAMM|nr:hypothetical protein [Kushneria phosphatilytica]QEL09858.1 hypothetical protein FY550_01065 [Kushneria phosphatilytica]